MKTTKAQWVGAMLGDFLVYVLALVVIGTAYKGLKIFIPWVLS